MEDEPAPFGDPEMPLDYQELTAMDEGHAGAKYTGSSGSVAGGGGRHGYEYYPQYLIKQVEKEAKERYNTARGMQTLTGPAVSKHITDYYVNRGFPMENAQHISGVVEGKIHRAHKKAAVKRVRRRRAKRIGGIVEEQLAVA